MTAPLKDHVHRWRADGPTGRDLDQQPAARHWR